MFDIHACRIDSLVYTYIVVIELLWQFEHDLSIEGLIEPIGLINVVRGEPWDGVVKRELGVECMHVRCGCPLA